MSVYQEIILDHYRNPHNFGSLKNPTKKSETQNPSCGDKLTMEIVEKKGIVTEIAFKGEGCVISMASASMLTDFAKGKSTDELKKLKPETIINMVGIELGPSRLRCALLSLETLQKVINS